LVPPRLALQVYQAAPYLGQGATIVASVSGADGTPLGDVPLTLVTTFGELRSDDGTERGQTIGVRTSPDGRVRAGLRVPLPEGMDAEQAAFDSAIRGLNPNARTPADDADALANLARQYAWEANAELRRAIDEYLLEFGKGLNEAVTARDFLHQWSDMRCAIVAYVTDDPGGTGAGSTVLRAATATVTFRNWLGAFLQTSLNLAQGAANINQELNLMTQLGTNPAGIVEGVYSRTRFYTGQQFGAVGTLVGRKVSDNAVRDLLTAAIGSAATDGSRAVSQALEAGRGTAGAGAHLGVATAQTSTLGNTVATKADVAVVDKVRGDLTATIGTKADASSVEKLRGDLITSIGTKADVSAVDKVRSDLTATIGTKADASAVDKVRSDLTTSIATKADVSAVDKVRSDLTTSIAGKADASAVDKVRSDLTTNIGTKADVSAVDKVRSDLTTSIATKADVSAVDKVRSDLTTSIAGKADASAVDKVRSDLTTSIAGKADVSAVDKVRSDLTTSIGGKADVSAVDKVRSDLTTSIAAKADAAVLEKLRTDVNSSIADLGKKIGTKAEVSALQTFQTQVTNSLATKADSVAVEKLRTDVTSQLSTKVDTTTFNTRVPINRIG
jgi:antitoxin component HigA of HigAB toxin-antitoxin module